MKQSGIYLPIVLLFLIGCKGKGFNGIHQYKSIVSQHTESLSRAVAIIKSNSKADSTYVYDCTPDETTQHLRPTIQISELCEIFQQCSIKEAVHYKSGSIYLMFNRLLPDQDYGVFLTVDKNYYKDTATSKHYLERIPKSGFYLNAETDW